MNSVSAQWVPGSILGDGSANDPWQITTIKQLAELADYVNAGNGPYTAGIYYKLMNDIIWPNRAIWSPIGNNKTSTAIFQGNFNGNGNKVSGIHISGGAIAYIGLFGYVSSAHIHDLGVEVYRVINGEQYVGGLIGRADYSTIENCYVAGNIAITGNSIVGGLIGLSYFSTISDSYAICDASGVSAVGGFVGVNHGGSITYCYATGNITATGNFIGGLVGDNRNGATVKNCVAANNTVTGGTSVNRVAGANAGTISHNYAFDGMPVNGAPVIGGAHNDVNGESETISTLQSFNFYSMGSNWDNNTPWSIATNDDPLESWKICDGETLPFLQWEGIECDPTDPCDEFQDGSINFPFLICTVQDFVDFANDVNSGGTTIGMYWMLMNDLDLVGIMNWNPIGDSFSFQGHFDGNGKVISNLTINLGTTLNIGLFGRISNAEIKNLGIEVCHVAGDECVGALVGYISGISTIENCYVTECSISGYRIVGGLIGAGDYYSNLTIKNCYATGSVIGTADVVGGLIGWPFSATMSHITNSYAICDVSGTSSVGGFVGVGGFYGIINNCFAGGNAQATGNIIGGLLSGLGSGSNFYITDSYVNGNVIGSNMVGGLVGYIDSMGSDLINCVAANSSVSGSANVNRIVGANGGVLSHNYANEDMLVNGVTVIGGMHNNHNGEGKPMSTLKSYNFYNTGSNWYNTIPWSIDEFDNPLKIWKICDGLTLPFFQWEGISCSKKTPYAGN